MKVAFFISDHGFGHIMRNLPVAEELIRRGHSVIIVTGKRQAEIAEQYLGPKVKTTVCNTDAGLVVKPGTLCIDTQATICKVRDHLQKWPGLIAAAPIADIYVVDIVPWALTAAKKRGISCILMANFTWLEQYKPFLPEEMYADYLKAYSNADKVLYYDLVNLPTRELLGEGENVGFVARHFNEVKVERIRSMHANPIVFVSLGASNFGLDFDIDVGGLPYDFIATRALKLVGDNVEYLDVSVQNTQDYVKAADFCIAKAGWGTVAEAMLAGVPFAVLEREDTPEDRMTIEMLKNREAAISIAVEELKDMRGVIRRMEEHAWPRVKYENGAKRVAEIICGDIRTESGQ